MVRTWASCQSVCRQKYQDLAQIENAAENLAAMAAMTEPEAWIGLYRHTWLWSDLSSSRFRNWDYKYLDNTLFDQHCVTMSDRYVWDDNFCTELRSFICQKEAKIRSVINTQLKIETKLNLSDPANREKLLHQLREKVKQENPGADLKVKWSKVPTEQKNPRKTTEKDALGTKSCNL
ncbi:unnamed protein product [Knipowitschia caucasica]|uniref:C-type lectin domain-containing protein n=1 Tax=Knipowitschia caucasica TaxID=637954 RepID=A0AAV2JFT5_KNICA